MLMVKHAQPGSAIFGYIYSESMALESDFKFAHCAQGPKAEAPVLLSDGLEMKLPSST